MHKGIYSLILILENDQYIEIGKLGNNLFKKGYYVYNGSALGGFGRVRYHLKEKKSKRWHIDYLIDKAKIVKIITSEVKINHEHDISKSLASKKDAEIPVIKFGSSDCNKGCKSHLVYFKKLPEVEDTYGSLGLKFVIFEKADFKNI
ncbi:MAG: GIY-YIG nuclease family protein [Methanofastidiosum sp.]|jgi:sugar fermentation stimulation protein A|nr:GIY-YIG nuclease family protein [Methanofastidiosum sp.]